MKDIAKRIVIGLVIYIVIISSFYVIVEIVASRRYKYMTHANEWGVSNYCYVDEKQNLYCEIDGVLKPVQQFYEE